MDEKQYEAASAERSAEILRMTLPVMSKHNVPVTPQNYAVWYGYTKGENGALREEIDKLIAQKAAFTDDVNTRLFSNFVSECDIVQFTKIRGEMSHIITDVRDSLHNVGQDAENFGGQLDGLVKNVEGKTSLDDIHQILKVLVHETQSMQQSTTRLNEHLESKSREIELLQNELEQERKRATTDPLTSLANRLAFFEDLEIWADRANKGAEVSLIMLDIDHFKAVNDQHGHLIGDRVIRFVAQVLDSSTKGQDTAARYGGEEFAVLLPETDLKGAQALAEKIRVSVADAKLVRSDNKAPLGQITISLGVAQFHPGEDSMEFLNRADQALYTSKHAGRNRVTAEGEVKEVQKA